MRKLALFVALVLTGCASPTVKAPWRTFPGARVQDECAKYAKAAESDLTQRGIPAFYTEYDWRSAGITGCHAVTLFKDEKNWWCVDNILAWPILVRGSTVLELIKSYDRAAYFVWQSDGCPLKLN